MDDFSEEVILEKAKKILQNNKEKIKEKIINNTAFKDLLKVENIKINLDDVNSPEMVVNTDSIELNKFNHDINLNNIKSELMSAYIELSHDDILLGLLSEYKFFIKNEKILLDYQIKLLELGEMINRADELLNSENQYLKSTFRKKLDEAKSLYKDLNNTIDNLVYELRRSLEKIELYIDLLELEN